MLRSFLLLSAVLLMSAGQASAQDESKIKLNSNGDFFGKAVTKNGEDVQGVKAQVTLTLDGKTVHSVVSDESGLFSFADVAPGVYTITATADAYVKTETVSIEAPEAAEPNAEPATDPAEPAITLPLEPVASLEPMYSMPMSSFAAPQMSSGGCSSCGSCGGGYGSSRFGGLRSGGFGRLLPLVGLVGLAGLGNNASPAN